MNRWDDTACVIRDLVSMALSGAGSIIAISLLELCRWRAISEDLERWTMGKLMLQGGTYCRPATPRPHSEFQ